MPWSNDIYPRDARKVQYQQVNVIYNINKMKDKNHIIMSMGTKIFDTIQHWFMTKTLSKVCIEGAYFNIIKSIYDKCTAKVVVKNWKYFL